MSVSRYHTYTAPLVQSGLAEHPHARLHPITSPVTEAEPLKLGGGDIFKHQCLANDAPPTLRGKTDVRAQRNQPTSAEMRLLPLFLRQTPVGDCTSSEEVPDA